MVALFFRQFNEHCMPLKGTVETSLISGLFSFAASTSSAAQTSAPSAIPQMNVVKPKAAALSISCQSHVLISASLAISLPVLCPVK